MGTGHVHLTSPDEQGPLNMGKHYCGADKNELFGVWHNHLTVRHMTTATFCSDCLRSQDYLAREILYILAQ